MKFKTILIAGMLIIGISDSVFSQSNIDTILKGGEILVNGLSFLKNSKSGAATNSKVIQSLCVKNKLTEKITVTLIGENTDGSMLKKEMVIQNDGKECLLELPKGIYLYEILLPNKEIYKKGEYRFDEEIIMTVKSN